MARLLAPRALKNLSKKTGQGKGTLLYAILEKETRTKMKTAKAPGLLVFGNRFFKAFENTQVGGFSIRFMQHGFESPITVALVHPNAMSPSAQIGLGFTRESVVIEAIQGESVSLYNRVVVTKMLRGKHGGKREFDVFRNKFLEEFREKTGVPWANFLLREIEKAAKKGGYKKIRIRRPETLYWYKKTTRKNKEKAREEMRKFYYTVARKEGYRKENDEFFVKEIK